MELAVETSGLSKRFTLVNGYRGLVPFRPRRHVEALDSVSLQVPIGSVFGLLGPNGAGKTTLLKILGTLILPTSGQARILGIDVVRKPSEVRQVLTYVVSEERSLNWRLTGRQNLRYFGALWGLSRKEAGHRIAELLELLRLEDAADNRVMYYSTGMRQKLALARGLLSDPAVLLLDEPTRSLDPLVAAEFWHFIRGDLVERHSKTVVVATHDLDEARRECDQVAVLHRGRLGTSSSIEELTRHADGNERYVLTLRSSLNGIPAIIAAVPGVLNVRPLSANGGDSRTLEITVSNAKVDVPLALEYAVAAGAKILACVPYERPLIHALSELMEVGDR